VEELAEAARARGIETHVLAEDDDIVELAQKAASSGSAVGSAGGDGSLAAVAGVAVEEDVPFVCIPFGTRNHFARDLGLDREDPIGALAAFDGEEQRLDIGCVDGRWFLNNVSLGLYASFVNDPSRKTRNRLLAVARLVPAALGRGRRPLDLSLDADGREEHHSALVVLVANNRYELKSLSELGERARIDEGRLYAYVIEAVSRSALLGLLARAVRGNLEQAEGWAQWSGEKFRLESSHERLHAAIDGEPAVLSAPLEFEVRPRALRVLLPAAQG
jgi:diacylglycerol kinase family enzyme